MLYNSQIVGQVIGRLRTDRGMSQEILSGLAGIARTHLTMIENGSKNASVETLWRIASALDIRLSELIRMVEEEHKKQPANRRHTIKYIIQLTPML
ncbi:MAG: helix-turn-helix domain-containing protein [Clostridia bacterium]|nr:helix-turn-helix domain-containing protein [Clostridia bacterium]